MGNLQADQACSDVTRAATLACVDVDPAGRIVARDAPAAMFLSQHPYFMITRGAEFLTVRPKEDFADALRRASRPFDARPSIIRADMRPEGPPVQVNVLPFRKRLIRIVLFVPLLAAPTFPSLSARERSVLQLAAAGQRRDRIAHSLNISMPTVDMHCRNLRRKLSAMTTSEAIAVAAKWNLLED
ncbi:LuxR C-terminal-related transcriptional regulator [Albirhodobacter sp. R86504]|uniref:helix-turn-helix transcriptional regulator n=1 Tax=Albirhodobacter sp. R86504 TaxID=3093848 RepID=UPI00366B826D